MFGASQATQQAFRIESWLVIGASAVGTLLCVLPIVLHLL
jgi:hypothetical protein